MKPEIQRLYLAAPLIYLKTPDEDRASGNPLFRPEKNSPLAAPGERLYCYEINPSQSLEFEPDGACLIKTLIFGAAASSCDSLESNIAPEKVELPPGNYLFSQTQSLLRREDIIETAVELQKEGLWQRLTPGDCLYLRFLHEDGRNVTQIFRPYR